MSCSLVLGVGGGWPNSGSYGVSANPGFGAACSASDVVDVFVPVPWHFKPTIFTQFLGTWKRSFFPHFPLGSFWLGLLDMARRGDFDWSIG